MPQCNGCSNSVSKKHSSRRATNVHSMCQRILRDPAVLVAIPWLRSTFADPEALVAMAPAIDTMLSSLPDTGIIVTYAGIARQSAKENTTINSDDDGEIIIYGYRDHETWWAHDPDSFESPHGTPRGGGGTSSSGDGGSSGGTSEASGSSSTEPDPTDAQYWWDSWENLECGALGALMAATHETYEALWLNVQADADSGNLRAALRLDMLRGDEPATPILQALWEAARIVNRQYAVLLRLCCLHDPPCGCCGGVFDYIALNSELNS